MGYKTALLLLLGLASCLYAQDTLRKPNIAVLNFTGDRTVEAEQLGFITGKMALELVETGAFIVLDRSRMEFILAEQGFQQSGSCNTQECHVQVGQLLGVDYLVSGNLVQFGPTYRLRLDYLDVGTGQIIKSVDLQKKGALYETMDALCREGAQKLVAALSGKKVESDPEPTPEVVPPDTTERTTMLRRRALAETALARTVQLDSLRSTPTAPRDAIPAVPSSGSGGLSAKRTVALALWGVTLAGVGVGYYFDHKGADAKNDYDNAAQSQDQGRLYSSGADMDDMAQYRNASYAVAIGSAALGLVLWIWPEGD